MLYCKKRKIMYFFYYGNYEKRLYHFSHIYFQKVTLKLLRCDLNF